MNQIDQLISQAGIQGTFDLRCLYRGGFRLPHEQSPAGVMPFHLLMKGEIRVSTAQGDDVTLRPGDLLLLPGGEPHTIWREGDTLTLGVGKANEPYEGIGRGMINIEGLPVYRDKTGGVGTPTSDNERTKMSIDTTHLVVLINGYDGDEQHVRENAEYIIELLKKYCQSDGGSYFIYK